MTKSGSGRVALVGHIISMTIDWSPDPAESVGTCRCGWVHREPRVAGSDQRMDAAIAAHWQATDTDIEDDPHRLPR